MRYCPAKRRPKRRAAALGIGLLFCITGVTGVPAAMAAPGGVSPAPLVVHAVASQPSQAVTVRVVRLTGFEQLKGNPAWVADEQQQLAGSVLQFNPDATFAWSTTGVRADLLPVQGTYTVSGTQWSFAGHNSTVIGGSSAFIEITGSLDVSSSTMTMTVASGAGYGAVVNGQQFGSNASSAYQGTMEVAPR